jgi:hypothetical protein
MDMQELYVRYEESKQYKDRWLGLYQGLYDFILPNRDAFNVKWNFNDNGKPETINIWDDTAVIAAKTRANEIQSLLTPKERTWGKFIMDPHLFDESEIAKDQPMIDEANERIMFYLNESNLSRAIYGANLDLVGGTGVLWAESPSDDKPILFRAIPAVTTYIEQTSEDVIGTSWFVIKMIGYKILREFPKLDGKVRTAVSENPNEVFSVLYGQIELEEDGQYYIYITLPDLDPHYVLWDAERDYKQIIIFRDSVRPGESEGRGIGIDMINTVRDLNHEVRDNRKNKAFKADPPMFYDNDKMFNPYSVRSWSGAMIARQPGGRNPIEALQMPVYPEVIESIRDLRMIVQKAFQVDQLGEVDSPVKSATEVSIRNNHAQRNSATNMSRIINEQPRQIFETAAKMLASRSLLTKDRSSSTIITKKLRFDFQSPLFDIQKEENINGFSQILQFEQQFFGEGAALASVDMGEALEFLQKNSNLPAKLFRDKESMNKLMQAMSQVQQPGAQPTPTTQAAPVGLPQSTPEQF